MHGKEGSDTRALVYALRKQCIPLAKTGKHSSLFYLQAGLFLPWGAIVVCFILTKTADYVIFARELKLHLALTPVSVYNPRRVNI